MPDFPGFEFLPPSFNWPPIPDFDWEEVIQRNNSIYISQPGVPYSRPVIEDYSSLAPSTVQVFTDPQGPPNWSPQVVADDEYLYYSKRVTSGSNWLIYRYKISDASETSVSLGSTETFPYISLISKNVLAVLVFSATGVILKKIDFTVPSLSTIFSVSPDAGEFYTNNPNFLYTYNFNGDIWSVFDWHLSDSTTSHYKETRFHLYNWDLALHYTVNEVNLRDVGNDRYIYSMDSESCPILMNGFLYVTYSPAWSDEGGGSIVDDEYALIVRMRLMNRAIVKGYAWLRDTQINNQPRIVGAVPYQSLNRLYFILDDIYTTGPVYNALGWCHGGDLVVTKTPMYPNEMATLIHSQSRAFRLDKDTGKVHELLTNAPWRTLSPIPPVTTVSEFPRGGGIGQAIDDTENRLWVYDATTGNIIGYLMSRGSTNSRTISTGITGLGLPTLLLMPKHMVFYSTQYSGSPRHAFYVVK
jgi:hypothetical protein